MVEVDKSQIQNVERQSQLKKFNSLVNETTDAVNAMKAENANLL